MLSVENHVPSNFHRIREWCEVSKWLMDVKYVFELLNGTKGLQDK